MIFFLAVTGNMPSWASFLTPIITGCEWIAAGIGVCAGIVALGLSGVHWLTHKHDWGGILLGVLGAVAGLGFSGAAVAIGGTLAGTVLVR